MKHFPQRVSAILLVIIFLMMAMPFSAFSVESAGDQADASEGVYQGEYDENGKRSGFGTWVYHNFVYIGKWENDLPNGEGVLYTGRYADSAGNPTEIVAIQAIRTDGVANGTVLLSTYENNANVNVYCFDVEQGRGTSTVYTDGITRNGEKISMGGAIRVCEGAIYGNVPPWAEIDAEDEGFNPFVERGCNPPLPGELTLPPWSDVALIAEMAAAEGHRENFVSEVSAQTDNSDFDIGIYEGEYDENGLRCGFGTWAYHNYLYVGNWRDNAPSGEGTLYESTYVEKNDTTGEIIRWAGRLVHGKWIFGSVSDEEYFDVRYSKDSGFELPLVYRRDRGMDMQPMLVNVRGYFTGNYFEGVMPPNPVLANPEIETPWFMYEALPTGKVEYAPLTKIENTGMGITPGNIANGSAMAALGDWIFMKTYMRTETKGKSNDVTTLYKMRVDGSQMMKLREHMTYFERPGMASAAASPPWDPKLQAIGDLLYVGEERPMKDADYKAHADDISLTPEDGGYPPGLVVDEWVYQLEVTRYWGLGDTLYRYRLDNTERTTLGNCEPIEIPPEDQDVAGLSTLDSNINQVLFADTEWVYIYRSGLYVKPVEDFHPVIGMDEIIKVKNDGSGEVKIHRLGKENSTVEPPQIVGEKLYYREIQYAMVKGDVSKRAGDALLSVDLNFADTPTVIIPRKENEEISAFHVTDDFVYYCNAPLKTGKGKTSSIIRVNHDGSNPVVLLTGMKQPAINLSIAGDWMMFETYDGQFNWYLMRLDGSGFHKIGDPYISEDAPDITDSSGKWRYGLLPDGTAKLLGAGSKLKLSGKLALPAAVDKIPVTAIGDYAFSCYEAVTSVTIPKSVTHIGHFAFQGMGALKSATIPEGVTHIGDYAFSWCSRLGMVSLPASLTHIGSEPFAHCDAQKLSVAKKNEAFTVVDGVLVAK